MSVRPVRHETLNFSTFDRINRSRGNSHHRTSFRSSQGYLSIPDYPSITAHPSACNPTPSPKIYACTTNHHSVPRLCEIIQQTVSAFHIPPCYPRNNLGSLIDQEYPTQLKADYTRVTTHTDSLLPSRQGPPHHFFSHVDRPFRKSRSRKLRGVDGIFVGVCTCHRDQVSVQEDRVPGCCRKP